MTDQKHTEEIYTLKIVRGVAGDCIVIDDTRIAGPKPWGGGTVTKSFRIDKKRLEDACGLSDLRRQRDELMEALEKMTSHYTTLVNSGDAGNWNPEEEDEVILARTVLTKTKVAV